MVSVPPLGSSRSPSKWIGFSCEDALAFVQQLDELGDAAFEVKCLDAGGFLALIGQDDPQALVQKRELAQALS